jgi:hypothetical protein
MFTYEIFSTIITHSLFFFLGIVFDSLILRKLHLTNEQKVTIRWSELVRVTVLLSVFLTFLASIVSSQFFAGEEPTLWLSIGGVFSFGSLIGEADFFKKLLSGFVEKK